MERMVRQANLDSIVMDTRSIELFVRITDE